MASNFQSLGRPDPILLDGIGFGQPPEAFISERLPCIVDASGGAYAGNIVSHPLAMLLGDKALVTGQRLKRAPGSRYAEPFTGYDLIETAYQCVERAAQVVIDDQDLERAGALVDRKRAQLLAPVWATMRLQAEYEVVAKIFDTGTYATAALAALGYGSTQVSWTADNSLPINDGRSVQETIRAATGVRASYAVISHDVAERLAKHPQILGMRVVGDIADGPTSQILPRQVLDYAELTALLARAWGLPDGVFVADALYNNAMPGQTASLAELSTGKVAFHTAQGVRSAFQNSAMDVELGAGPCSLVIARESQFRLISDRVVNPHGEQHVLKHSFGLATPSNMTSAAFVLTACV